MLGFLLIAVSAVAGRSPRAAFVAFVSVGATLWVPYSYLGGTDTMWVRHLVWAAATVWLVALDASGPHRERQAS